MPYQNIENYGMIGDLHTAALVSARCSIDWCCLPRFDSPSVFASILDDEKGGFFRISVTADCHCKQMYLPDTNVLVTRFLSVEGVGEVVDLMPWHGGQEGGQAIVRIARCVRGSVPFRLECVPAFDYARRTHETAIAERCAIFRTPALTLDLQGNCAFLAFGSGVVSEFALRENESKSFVLKIMQDDQAAVPMDVDEHAQHLLNETLENWRRWAGKCTYTGRWREMVLRSALTLKMLIYEPTGAIIAAPTCSLPESLGGVRNWDYRYTWIRDAAFTIYAMLRLGYHEEATRFMAWLQARIGKNLETGPLQVMYCVDGSPDVKEFQLDHLAGYQGSRPVRVGNQASNQLQLDIYGELIDSIYLYNKHVQPIGYDFWLWVKGLAEWVCQNWRRPDHGIWEVRKDPEQFTYSKMQCWVGLDRALRIAQKRNLPLDIDVVRKESQAIYESIMEQGWNGESFVQTLGGEAVDATSLLFPLMLFVSARDPRMSRTTDRVLKDLVSDSLVYRYKLDGAAHGDGLPGEEGTFSVCTFWLVEVLSRQGRLKEARFIFEKMLTYANHLGLFAEEIGPTGEARGNFPQAFTHLGLISAALNLDRELSQKR